MGSGLGETFDTPYYLFVKNEYTLDHNNLFEVVAMQHGLKFVDH
jgi:hypothetical protein